MPSRIPAELLFRWTSRVFVAVALVLGAGVASHPVHAQQAESSNAAKRQYGDAVLFQNQSEYALAVDEWKVFLEKYADDPLAPKAQHYLGVCHLQLKQYDAARDAFNAVLAKHPQFELKAQLLFNLGIAQFNLAQAGQADAFAGSAEALAALVKEFPESKDAPKGLFYLGEANYGAGKREAAVEAWSQLAKNFPKSELRADALYALGVAQEELGQHAEAGATYDEFLKAYPEHANAAEVGMRKGETLFAAGNFAEAGKRFAAAAQKDDFALADHATLRWAASLWEQKNYAESAAAYASIPARFPQSKYVGTATLAAGNMYYLAEKYDAAREWLQKAAASGGEAGAEAAHWIARSWLKENKPAEALQAVEPALAASAGTKFHTQLMLDEADALYEIADRRAQAGEKYAALADQFPQDAAAPQARYMAAFAALKQDQFDRASEQAAKFLTDYPQDALAADVLYVQAESRLLAKDFAVAAQRYDQLLAAHANHPDASAWQLRRVLAMQLAGNGDEAIAALESLTGKLTSAEAKAEAFSLLGTARLEKDNFEQARQAYTQSLEAAPQWRSADEVLLNLSRAQRGAGDLPAAIQSAEQMLKLFPESRFADRAHFRLGEYAYAAKDFARSAKEYEQVLTDWPQSEVAPHSLYGLGWAKLGQQDFAAAEEAFGKFLTTYPDHTLATRALYARANARVSLKNFAGALEDAQAYLAKMPSAEETADAMYLLGLAQVGLKQFEPAAATFAKLLEQSPDYGAADRVTYELAWAQKGSGQHDASAASFQQLVAKYPESSYGAEALFHVGEHQFHQKKSYKAAALSYYNAHKKASGGELGEKALHKLGWAYYELKDYANAQKTFQALLKSHPNGALLADTQFMLGESLTKLDKPQAALTAYQAALSGKLSSPSFERLALLHAAQAAGKQQLWDNSLELLARLQKLPEAAEYQDEILFEEAWAMLNQGKADEAAKRFETVADRNLSEVGARAHFMLGESALGAKNYTEAVRHYFKVAYGFGHPQSPPEFHVWQAASTYQAAETFRQMNNAERARKLYSEVLERFPKSDKAPLAKQRLASLK